MLRKIERENCWSKISSKNCMNSKYPNIEINQFFVSFSWVIPSKEAPTSRGYLKQASFIYTMKIFIRFFASIILEKQSTSLYWPYAVFFNFDIDFYLDMKEGSTSLRTEMQPLLFDSPIKVIICNVEKFSLVNQKKIILLHSRKNDYVSFLFAFCPQR